MKKSEIIKKILLAASGISSTEGSTTAIGVDKALYSLGTWYKSQNRRGRYRIRKIFAELRRSGLIELPQDENKTRIALTEEGKKVALEHQIKSMKMLPQNKWDKKWRLVIFDVPEGLKTARNAFRKKLQDFGFLILQKNVWVYPYECRHELDLIADFFGIRKYIKMIDALRFDNEELVKRQFNLQ